MKFSKSILAVAAFAAAGALMAFATPAVHASLIGDYSATNYNPTTGVWTDSSGNNNNATYTAFSGSNPTLGAVGTNTTNGSETVNLPGTGYFSLATPIPVGPVSIFVYLNPTTNTAAIAGGSGPNYFEYRLNTTQDALQQEVADLGHSNTTVPTGTFSSLGVQFTNADPGTVSYFLNGAADGTTNTTAVTTLATPYLFSTVYNGGAGGSADGSLAGNVAEIRIYSDTGVSAATVNSAFQAAYVTGSPTVPEPATLGLLGIGGMALLKRRRKTA